ncbi:hypothetical protein NQZ79_g639 [Umbelopsis isabellina]|nr:hypothetical protein NQZ79_g639 [Umbelopsis isabellina]
MGTNPFEDGYSVSTRSHYVNTTDKSLVEAAKRRRRSNRIIAISCIVGSFVLLCVVFGGFSTNEVASDTASSPRMAKRNLSPTFDSLLKDEDFALDDILNDMNFTNSAQANANVPPLSEPFPYGEQPIRGINLGGWLVLEPFIKPSIFKPYNQGVEKVPTPENPDRVIDEYTLTKKLGPKKSYDLLKEHYETWVTEETFARVAELGFDHVRIPIGFWAVRTWEGDPYVPRLSLAYFLQALEWARKYGLRVNLDLHSAPQSQNGWNHSGRQGQVRWLAKNTTHATQEISQILEVIDELTRIVVSPRYKNVVTIFGILNEPNMRFMEVRQLLRFYDAAYRLVRTSGFDGYISVSEGFIGLNRWKGKLSQYEKMMLDAHIYHIFDPNSMKSSYRDKVVNGICNGAYNYVKSSQNLTTGFGPTIVGEWSAADTDCALWLNNVGQGSHWDGSYYEADGTKNEKICEKCSCKYRNEASLWPTQYRDYLKMYVQGQLDAFSTSYGYFFWNFKVEGGTEPHWSYFDLVDLGIAPKSVHQPDFTCADVSSVPARFDMAA